ncbi:carboxylic ester hydrolase-like [Rhodnius prolixus]|uniref:carboxylic ester hydrolase-like n=1 Tax=Rhodnius prolixus TaxID=13249 RepID=UPI003D18AB9F
MNLLILIIEISLLLQFAKCCQLIVNTTCGTLIGLEFTTANGRIVAAFHSIPFAKPPLGELRFQDPQPSEAWPGVREAYNFGSVCVQIPIVYPPVNTTKMGNEDCLYLSVYSPNLNATNLLPVVVYIHGGDLFSGSGEINKSPEFVLNNDIVLVMPNYRLGVLGFLTLEDDIMPGNMALKDQVMALVWIQNNIANFGGDPNQVTLFGYNAGAVFVHYHMYSPMSRGLFHRAISQSGAALVPWANTPPGVARSRAIKMAQLFNCPTDSSLAIWNCLRTKNAYELTESYRQFSEFQVDPIAVFTAIFDKNAKNPFLPFNPHNAEPAPVLWIVGLDSLAGLIRSAAFVRNPASLPEYDRHFVQALPITLYFDTTASNPTRVAEQVRRFYFDDQPITMSLFRNFTDMFTDAYYLWPIIESLRKHKGPHHLYYFDYLGEHSFQEILAGRRVLTGASIFDTPIYIWHIKNPIEIPPPTSSEDLNILNLDNTLLYNVATFGVPTPPGSPINWPQWDEEQQNYFYIGNSELTIKKKLLPERVQFWSQLNLRDKVDG